MEEGKGRKGDGILITVKSKAKVTKIDKENKEKL